MFTRTIKAQDDTPRIQLLHPHRGRGRVDQNMDSSADGSKHYGGIQDRPGSERGHPGHRHMGEATEESRRFFFFFLFYSYAHTHPEGAWRWAKYIINKGNANVVAFVVS
jgi:hypothetical protein